MKKKVVLPIIGHNTQTGAQYVFLGEIDGPYMKVSTPNMYPKQWWSRWEYIQKYESNITEEKADRGQDKAPQVSFKEHKTLQVEPTKSLELNKPA
jgi:threonyl-tRNA synthetase